jgi:hypothetical protein
MIEMWGDIISSRVNNTGALTSQHETCRRLIEANRRYYPAVYSCILIIFYYNRVILLTRGHPEHKRGATRSLTNRFVNSTTVVIFIAIIYDKQYPRVQF